MSGGNSWATMWSKSDIVKDFGAVELAERGTKANGHPIIEKLDKTAARWVALVQISNSQVAAISMAESSLGSA